MSVEFGREYNYRHGLRVRYEHLNEEPVMVIERKKKNAKIGLSVMWRYALDHYMIASCTEIAKRIGLGDHINTIAYLCSVVENHIDELVGSPPEEINPMQTQNDLDRAIEQYGLRLDINGENLLH